MNRSEDKKTLRRRRNRRKNIIKMWLGCCLKMMSAVSCEHIIRVSCCLKEESFLKSTLEWPNCLNFPTLQSVWFVDRMLGLACSNSLTTHVLAVLWSAVAYAAPGEGVSWSGRKQGEHEQTGQLVHLVLSGVVSASPGFCPRSAFLRIEPYVSEASGFGRKVQTSGKFRSCSRHVNCQLTVSSKFTTM
jgi:hypothetical protein